MKNKYIIYRVTFPNNKVYIGLTGSGLKKRKANHYYDVKVGSNLAFHNALRKYKGLEIWEIIHKNIAFEDIANLEILEISNHNSTVNGYNLTYGGEGVRAVLITDETKLKMSLAKLGKKSPVRDDEWKRNISEAKKGNKNGMFGKIPPNKGIAWKDNVSFAGQQSHKLKVSKRVVMLNEKMEELICFKSIVDATIYCGLKSKSCISSAVINNKKSAGFYWKLIKEL